MGKPGRVKSPILTKLGTSIGRVAIGQEILREINSSRSGKGVIIDFLY